MFTGSDPPNFATIKQDGVKQSSKQNEVYSSVQVLLSPNIGVGGVHLGGRNSQTAIDFWERLPLAANSNPKVHKAINK